MIAALLQWPYNLSLDAIASMTTGQILALLTADKPQYRDPPSREERPVDTRSFEESFRDSMREGGVHPAEVNRLWSELHQQRG
jgi:hypothetical protein